MLIPGTLLDYKYAERMTAIKIYEQYEQLHSLYSIKEFPIILDKIIGKFIQQYLDGNVSFQE